MSRSSPTRRVVVTLLLLSTAACTQLTAPPVAHDDPSTCLSGYTIINGVVVCNP